MGHESSFEKVRIFLVTSFEISNAIASRDQDVIRTLESIADQAMALTGFFHNGSDGGHGLAMQNGVARTNCIDCLDRTNAAQFVIGKRALGHQLHALGIISDTSIEFDTDAVNMFTHMYETHATDPHAYWIPAEIVDQVP